MIMRPDWRLRFSTCSSTVARTKIRVQQKNKLNFYVYRKQICCLFTKKKKKKYELYIIMSCLCDFVQTHRRGQNWCWRFKTRGNECWWWPRTMASERHIRADVNVPARFGLMGFFSRESRLMLKKTYNDSVSSKKTAISGNSAAKDHCPPWPYLWEHYR